jgi:hypothetical protein
MRTTRRSFEGYGVRSVLLVVEYGPVRHKGSRRGREQRYKIPIKILRQAARRRAAPYTAFINQAAQSSRIPMRSPTMSCASADPEMTHLIAAETRSVTPCATASIHSDCLQ